MEVVPDATHVVFRTELGATAAALRSFLGRHRDEGSPS
jgi:hypothetical protein